ncbi:hypothetical protein ABW286_21515 [Erwinia papayae]|uniref:TraL n=1 Tax=Erwinia papayae TaxID=206499 RepID=A0ABV3N7G6_9GAMM|nr:MULTISPECIES: hypothetical protein [Enterobacterales]EKC9670500.1 hypothetical protein [Escherichia coli]HCK6787749.1 hypothetical protein [Salmonella enterica subsp. enterica serovar Typhi str. CT18]HEB0918922.1 hypothetical protein [Enterobacter cloacae]MBL0881561.1 hypothetical protein [Serratia ureilytica]MDN2473824.1 hypothetical protein [Serratia ureilytica]
MNKTPRHNRCQVLKCSLVAGVLLLPAFSVLADQNCAAGTAAQKAAEAALNAEIEQINKEAEDSFVSSDAIGKCLGSLSTSITLPSFPGIGGVLDRIKQEVCQAARQKITEKISSKIPTQIDPWGELSRKYLPQNVQQYLPDSSGKNVQINAGADGVNSNAGSTKENSAFPFHL